LKDGGQSDDERLTFVFRRCVARHPSDSELATLKKLLSKEQRHFAAGDAKPWDLAAADPAHPPKLPDGASPAEFAAWTVVSRAL
jgi:hypothetical protein